MKIVLIGGGSIISKSIENNKLYYGPPL